MKITNLIEVLTAAHLSIHVDGPFPNRGGLMLVAPPASFKTTAIEHLRTFPNARCLSDINAQQLSKIRDDIANNLIRTLAFPEFEKLYQRHDSTAANIEGTLKLMAEEGFSHASHEDQRMVVKEARALIVGGMTQATYKRRYPAWKDDGFARRFLWCYFVLQEPQVVYESIHKWERLKIKFNHNVFALPMSQKIAYQVTKDESAKLYGYLTTVSDFGSAFVLLKKILCVLKWRYPEVQHGDRAWKIMEDFSECLQKYAELTIEDEDTQLLLELPPPRGRTEYAPPEDTSTPALLKKAKASRKAKVGQ